ncbi:MarR family winged helix-turn-helix transcriptional regulator [Nocardioides sp. URHA0020]|uniref:MarR family winged helix-turn-helix transcriptional regulator n=1 Tax=Nocardioides sp. URHA0020 TaxID=1380392 RepID=UPI000490359D|nr:MarR family winged helix-turn-helix transcriptional regulator [Nocardioides sp. URHA0020]
MAEGRLATEHADAPDSTGLLLWRVTNTWQAAQRAALKPHGLTHVQFVLLASLVWLDTDETITQRDLADHAGTDPMMTSQVLRALEAAGHVVRRPHPTDARARSLAATPAGVALANRAVVDVEAVDRAFFGRLGEGRADFTALLATLSRR